MEKHVCLFSFLLSTTLYVCCQKIQTMVILPTTTYVIALDGDPLQLDCVVIFTGQPNVSVVFSKDGMELKEDNDRGYDITYTEKQISKSDSQVTVETKTTFRKNVTNKGDKGRYDCEVSDDSRRIEVIVFIFKASSTSANLPADGTESTPVELQCYIEITTDNTYLTTYNISWERDGKKIENNEKFDTNRNALKIRNSERSDMGEYQCVITFFADSLVEKQSVRPKPSLLMAGPLIDYYDGDKSLGKEDILELKCKVSGFPKPTVTWLKDGAEINTTTRIHTLEYEGTMGILKIYSLEDEDEGYYKCFAENKVAPFNATAEMRVRVKENGASTSTTSISVLLSQSVILITAFFVLNEN